MKKQSYLLVPSILLVIGFQNCSDIEALKSAENIVSYKNAVAGSPNLLPVLSKQSISQSPLQYDISPINQPLVAQQIDIVHQRDISAGHSTVINNTVVPVPPPQQTVSAPDCECDQFNLVSAGYSLVAQEEASFSQEALDNILNVQHTQLICSVRIPRPTRENPFNVEIEDVLTGELTYFRCSGRGHGATTFDYNVRHYGYRAPNGCRASGNPIVEEPNLICRHPADTDLPHGVLSNDEFARYTSYQGLGINGLPDNNPAPPQSCQDMYNLYIGLAIGTGQNSTYFPNRSLECRAAYFAAAYAGTNLQTGANHCFTEMIAANPSLTLQNCPQPEDFNCQASASGCTNGAPSNP